MKAPLFEGYKKGFRAPQINDTCHLPVLLSLYPFGQGTDIRNVSDHMLEGSSGPSRPSHPPFPSFEKTHLGPPAPLDLNKTSKTKMKLANYRFLVPHFVFLRASRSSWKPFRGLSKMIKPKKKDDIAPETLMTSLTCGLQLI